jgi:hypothetical protein
MRNYWTLVEGHMAVLTITPEQAAELQTRYPSDPDCQLRTGPVPLDDLMAYGGCHIDTFNDPHDPQTFIDKWLMPELAE